PSSGATTAMNYLGVSSGAAGIIYNGPPGAGKVVYLGFPFETITSATVRNAYMASVLGFFVTNLPPTPIKFTSITLLGGNTVKLVLTSEPGIYTLETAAVLGAWTPLTNLTNVAGTVEFVDGSVATQAARFYRAKTWP